MRLLSNGEPFPSIKELKDKYNHNLTNLKTNLISLCFAQNSSIPIIEIDKEFLKEDVLLNELLLHLTDFANGERYVYMNNISKQESTGKWLSSRWNEIESKIVPAEQALQMVLNGQENEYKLMISRNLVLVVEKLLGALCRTITIGKMDKDSNGAATVLFDFLLLKESELGTRNYELFGPSPV